MNHTHPTPLTPAEWTEIGEVALIRDFCGAPDSRAFAEQAAHIYGARFDFHSGSPRYVGDLYILQGDALAGYPPVTPAKTARWGGLDAVDR